MVVRNLPVATAIFVKTKTGRKYRGDVIVVTEDSLVIASGEAEFPGRTTRRREMQRTEIHEIRLTAPVKSVATGAGIGAGVGAGIGVGLDATAKSHEYRGTLAVIMGLFGPLIGAAVAHHFSLVKGHRIYLAP
jgi:hypothetical protein